MPTYDYKCPDCGELVEKLHGMLETPIVLCKTCGKVMVKQIGTGGHLTFVGAGFYTNDYGKGVSNKKGKHA